MQKSKKTKTVAASVTGQPSFVIDLSVGTAVSVYDAMLEAIDEAFLSLGEQAKVAIYLYLEKSTGIKKQEIPFRIDDFQVALERLFGEGARYLEILVIGRLHEKLQTSYRWDMPSCVVPDLTFKDYLRLVNRSFEVSNAKNKHRSGGPKN